MLRAIRAAKRKRGAPNFLCALGLLCYTEFAGGLDRDQLGVGGQARSNFDHFFQQLGVPYAQLLKDHNIYDILRCGLAHEYYVKHHCSIAMLTNHAAGKPDVGVSYESNTDSFVFRVEPYFRDFMAAFNSLEKRLRFSK